MCAPRERTLVQQTQNVRATQFSFVYPTDRFVIGVPFPVSFMVDTVDTGTVPEAQIQSAVQKVCDLTPSGIITTPDLLMPNYRNTVVYEHVGRSEFGRKRSDRVGELQGVWVRVGPQPGRRKSEEHGFGGSRVD